MSSLTMSKTARMPLGLSSPSKSRLARFYLDFSELMDSPYDGVSVHLDDANMYKLCLHLCPPSGPFKGLRLHFDVQLPDSVSFPLCL
jgi:hypothetical protein